MMTLIIQLILILCMMILTLIGIINMMAYEAIEKEFNEIHDKLEALED